MKTSNKISSPIRLELPQSLQSQLGSLRQRLWTTKSFEAVGFAVLAFLAMYTFVYLIDRFVDTPTSVRWLLLLLAVGGSGLIPWYAYRWIWQRRRHDQLAQLVWHKDPLLGDQLLGIIELVQNKHEQQRSPELCAAAIDQVSQVARDHDLTQSLPRPRHKEWLLSAGAMAVVALLLGILWPDAARNAWARYLTPWRQIDRFTFTQVQRMPERFVVPHGEPFTWKVRLAAGSRWTPAHASLTLGDQSPLASSITNVDGEPGFYHFEAPALLNPTSIRLSVGDYVENGMIEPMVRPELTSVSAQVSLPSYLQRSDSQSHDVRSGSSTLVKGSKVQVMATASRELASAEIDGQQTTPQGPNVTTPWKAVEQDQSSTIEWTDAFGLTGHQPFQLSIRSRSDEAPTIICEGLPRQKVVLETEALTFNVRALDDFGVKQVGLEWKGLDSVATEMKGERVLSAGSPTSNRLEVVGTFSAKAMGIEPQPIQVRLFTEDYLPDRPRAYSPAYTLFVLSPEDHAIWLTDQLSKWHRQSLDVRDREMQLYETNRQFQQMSPDELDDPKARREIQAQATAERANGRRLERLTSMGEDLVKQASRNPEFGVGHLEKWAEMLQILKDISANRIPSVAEKLAEAAKAAKSDSTRTDTEPSLADSPSKTTPSLGTNRMPSGRPNSNNPNSDGKETKPSLPALVDGESSQQPQDPNSPQEAASPKPPSSPRFGLPVTTLAGSAKSNEPTSCPVSQQIDQAVVAQQELLNEFDKIADELNEVLASLEGTTLVKRLKAAARVETKIAGRVGDQVEGTFGSAEASSSALTLFDQLEKEQLHTGNQVSLIMDDMQAFYERRRMAKFKSILDEMRKEDVLGSLRQLAAGFRQESGLSIAQCEFWSDTLDRWAEDLVDPVSGGT